MYENIFLYTILANYYISTNTYIIYSNLWYNYPMISNTADHKFRSTNHVIFIHSTYRSINLFFSFSSHNAPWVLFQRL